MTGKWHRAAALAGTLACAAAPLTVDRRVVGSLTLENIPPTPPALAESLRAYENVRGAAFEDWLADGSMLIATRFGQTAQIHHVAFPGGARQQITFYDEPVADALARPGHAGQFLFRRDTGGAEYYQIYLADLNGHMRVITTADTRNVSPLFSRDGALLAWASVARGHADYDIWVMQVDHPETRRVAFHGSGEIDPLAFSPDGKRLLVQHLISAASQKLFLLDIDPGTVAPVNPSVQDIAYELDYGAPQFTPDGRALILASNQGSDFKQLVRYDLATGGITPVSGPIGWDIEGFALSPDGKSLAYGVNRDGFSEIFLRDLAGGPARAVPLPPHGVVASLRFSPDSTQLAIAVASSTQPLDIWSFTPATGRLARWTASELGGIDPASLVQARLIHFPSFDKRAIPAYIYQPASPHGRLPVVIGIHGGPEAQERPGFIPVYQYWANVLGVAIITPNIRGSDGYGRAYLALDNGVNRQDAVRDIGALLDWIATQPELDPARVVVSGGSYGGFMTLSAFASYGDRLAGAYDIVGPSNLVTFLQHTEPYRRDLRRVEYGDERDPAIAKFLNDTAPLNNTAKMTKPLLVVAGRNDPRVPYTEDEQLVARVRAQGGDVWYMLANDEGHGFRKKSNRDAQRAAETMWLRKVLHLAQ